MIYCFCPEMICGEKRNTVKKLHLTLLLRTVITLETPSDDEYLFFRLLYDVFSKSAHTLGHNLNINCVFGT